MSPDEQAHAESIATPPSLKILPFAKPVRVLCGGPVRKRADVLRAHLASLAAQELPPRVTVDYAFVNDFPEPCEGSQVLADFVAAHAGRLLVSPNPARDFSDEHPVTHQWSVSAMNRMGLLKTLLLQACVQGGYDWLWLVDSDLILDPTTLASLLSAQKAVVAAVYWTKWHSDPRIHSGPQVWLKPPYQLSLPHYPESEFRTTLGVKRQLEKVAGLGACTLIARSVIEKGVQFGKPPGFASGGLWDGEDRHFCEWARRLHVELWADAWPDIFHCYHPKDVERLPGMTSWLATAHPKFANHGHLVSLRLTNIEDGIGPTMVRCRVGDGTLLPELELAVLKMQRGETKIVPIHFPATTPPTGPLKLAGLTRLISVDLIDTRPFTLPPVLGDEFYQTHEVVADTTQFTEAQHAHIAESANA